MFALVLLLIVVLTALSTTVGRRAISGRQFESAMRAGYDA